MYESTQTKKKKGHHAIYSLCIILYTHMVQINFREKKKLPTTLLSRENHGYKCIPSTNKRLESVKVLELQLVTNFSVWS